MKEFLIKTILSWLAGITAEQWKSAVSRVVAIAQIPQADKQEKQVRFSVSMEKLWGEMKPWIINLLREMAVAYARRKGLIK